MDDKLALYTMLSMARILYFHLGWDGAQRDLGRVGEEFTDKIIDEEKLPRGDAGAVLEEAAKALARHGVAKDIAVEVAGDVPAARSAVGSPYRVRVEGCAFRELHSLFKEYGFRRNWNRSLTKHDGMFLVCPVMNMLVHAVETSSDCLAGHSPEAAELSENSCTCLIDIFPREIGESAPTRE